MTEQDILKLTHTVHIKTIIKSYIFDKATYPRTNCNNTNNPGSDAETDADARIDTLVGIVVDTITTGLSARLHLKILVQAMLSLWAIMIPSDILLITDTVENRVVYSFQRY